MSQLEVRKLPGNFEGVDFIWNEDHPFFSIQMNKLSFWAIGFEKYLCSAIRDALPLGRTGGTLCQGPQSSDAAHAASQVDLRCSDVTDALAQSRAAGATRLFPRMDGPV